MKTDALDQANRKARQALSEVESKKLLKTYGVPVVNERVAHDAAAAVKEAENLGYPVALKGFGRALLHKTEQGLVHLNLQNARDVEAAAEKVARAAGRDLEGFVIQPFLVGKREFVAGLTRDPQFGPVVMFGLGGIFTEALNDVTFRLAPLTKSDAAQMVQEIRAQKLLSDFRGERAVDQESLVACLLGLSRLGMEHPDIAEVDINPLLATADGGIHAVDALVVHSPVEAAGAAMPPVAPTALGALFHPRSIAFVGASGEIGKWGHTLLTNTVSGGFAGKVYLVNHKGQPIAGREVYKSVRDLPEKVDLAVVTIPAAHVMDLIPDLSARDIRNVLLISSGFGETGADGKRQEEMLVQKGRDYDILILGPNTMGICNPHINLYCSGVHARLRPGSTAIVSQSGNMGTQLLGFAEQQDIGIRGFCGSGNEAMMTVEDFLEAFEYDDLTRIVMLYVESAKNARRFFESARRVGRKKPVILLKGGQSEAGHLAAASHTGAMASDIKVFSCACKQAGIVKVERPMDLLDLSAAFSSLPLPRGKRAAIMTLGGGWGVITADLCSEYGLEVPPLSPELIDTMDKLLPSYWSRSNPIDLVGERDHSLPLVTIETLLKWDGCDAVINLGILGRRIMLNQMTKSVSIADPNYTPEFLEVAKQYMYDYEKKYIRHIIELMEQHQKPVFGVSLMTDAEDKTVYREKEDSPYSAVFYPTPERAVKAFAKMYEYQQFLNRKP